MVEVTESPWTRGDWMQTFTGIAFTPMDPLVEDISVIDIGHALSHICRYGGHVNSFYSVAEHSVLLSDWFLQNAASPDHVELAKWALIHDAAEAYLGDIVRPIKKNIPVFKMIEDHLLTIISGIFGLPTPFIPPQVLDADTRILLDERAVLLSEPPQAWVIEGMQPLDVEINAWEPIQARDEWFQRCYQLFGTLEIEHLALP